MSIDDMDDEEHERRPRLHDMADLGVVVQVVVNLASDDSEHIAAVTYTFGVGQYPTKADVDAAIRECIEKSKPALGPGTRITNLSDFGFAREPRVEWKFDDPAPATGADDKEPA